MVLWILYRTKKGWKRAKWSWQTEILLGWYIVCFMGSNSLVVVGFLFHIVLQIRDVDSGHFFFFSALLCALNSCMNPFFYARKSKEVQDLRQKLLCKKPIHPWRKINKFIQARYLTKINRIAMAVKKFILQRKRKWCGTK